MDQSQRDTDAGMMAYILEHPDEFLTDLVALATV